MMLELDFELLTDVCFSNANHTLGDPETHECIPGRALWGAVATLAYRKGMSEDEAFRLFHQGKVRFLTAVPVQGEARTYPAPGAWHKPKDAGEAAKATAFSNFALDDVRNKVKGEQYQAQKSGWYTTQVQPIKVETTYTLRTAVDPTGKAQEGLLYGLPAIRAGTRFWGALVGDDADVQKVAQLFLRGDSGELRLGRSRNSELGLVRVKKRTQSIQKLTPGKGSSQRVSFFCVSRCVFRDSATGSYTLNPSAAAFGLPEDWKMDPESSFLRSTRIVHFNSKRKRPEVERVAIESGSVFTFKGSKPIELESLAGHLERGVGEYTGQGYGEVLAAPDWLTRAEIAWQEAPKVAETRQVKPPKDDLFQWAHQRFKDARQREGLFEIVQADSEKLRSKRVPPAQWGALRQMAREASFRGSKNLSEQVKQFLSRGQRKLSREWQSTDKRLAALMELHEHELPIYLELLASACMRSVPEAEEGRSAR